MNKPAAIEEAKRLRRMHISVPDTMRQTGLSMFEVYECTEGRDAAVTKLARLHYTRGTGWPWDELDSDPDVQHEPTGDGALDAARAIVNLFRGRSLEDPVRQALDTFSQEERRQMVEIITLLVRRSS